MNKLKKHRGKIKNERGQSLVELTISLIFILALLITLMEFGFMLNYYLSLVDGTREVSRLASNWDPIAEPVAFYDAAVDQVRFVLEPRDANDTSRKIQLRSDVDHLDDIIVSTYSVSGGTATLVGAQRHWSNNQASRLDPTEINSRLIGTAPDTGLVAIEIFYYYDQVLGLPWLAMLPDPVMLYAYTIMPLSATEPTPTPTGP